MQCIVHDFEVFKHDWFLVCFFMESRTTQVLHNDRAGLLELYEKHKNDIWVGYNNKFYDQWIYKAILCGFDPKAVNDWIIKQKHQGWEFSDLLNEYSLTIYDCMSQMKSLKTLEGMMGNDIRETQVDFDLDRPLTQDEIDKTIFYCTHDVMNTVEVFLENFSQFESQMNLLKMFNMNLDDVAKTGSALVAKILKAKRRRFTDEFNISFPPTLKLNPYYQPICDWFMETAKLTLADFKRDWESKYSQIRPRIGIIYTDKDGKKQRRPPETEEEAKIVKYQLKFEYNVGGIPVTYGWGGLHGGEKVKVKGSIIDIDVMSLYPSLMIQYDYFSRTVGNTEKELYKQIYTDRIRLKKEGDKKHSNALKLILNSTYGCFKDRNNPLFDPLMANNICVAGQLLLTDLIDKLLKNVRTLCCHNVNTDGVYFSYDGSDEEFNLIDDVCYEWEKRTRLNLEFDYYTHLWQDSVNSYVALTEDGEVKGKGKFVKKLSRLDYDFPILNKALVNYLIDGTSIEDTVNKCDKLIEFQKIVKISAKYDHGLHNGEILTDTVFRVFASQAPDDTAIYKVKILPDGSEKVEKFADTPQKCFITNSDVNNETVPSKLDKQWYINEAKKRLKKFI